MNHSRWLQWYSALGTLFLLAAPVRAQLRDSSVRELQQQVRDLQRQIAELKAASQQKDQALEGIDQKVKILDRQFEVQQETTRETQRTLPTVQADSKGFWLKSQDESYKLHVGGYFQADSRFYTTQSPGASSTFLMRRVRPYFEGTLAKYYDFKVMLDFGQGQSVLQDAYGDIHYFGDTARLRLGKFKGPIGLERLQDDRYLLFAERALPTNLVPDRDIGGQIHGKLWNDLLDYQAALMNGAVDNSATTDADTNNAKDFLGRLFFHPFVWSSSELVEGLGVGIAGSYATSEKHLPLDTFRSAAQNVFFAYKQSTFAAGNRFRYSPQFYYHTGPFGLMGEFVWNSQELGTTFLSPKNCRIDCRTLTRTRQIPVYAWQLAPSYILTGEDATYDGVKPRHPFDPRIGNWGAFEIAARWDGLRVDHDVYDDGFADPTAAAEQASEWAVGVNWYLNNNIKLQVDYARTTFQLGAPSGDRKPESAFITDFELMF